MCTGESLAEVGGELSNGTADVDVRKPVAEDTGEIDGFAWGLSISSIESRISCVSLPTKTKRPRRERVFCEVEESGAGESDSEVGEEEGVG